MAVNEGGGRATKVEGGGPRFSNFSGTPSQSRIPNAIYTYCNSVWQFSIYRYLHVQTLIDDFFGGSTCVK
jgi:hypothetical protein